MQTAQKPKFQSPEFRRPCVRRVLPTTSACKADVVCAVRRAQRSFGHERRSAPPRPPAGSPRPAALVLSAKFSATLARFERVQGTGLSVLSTVPPSVVLGSITLAQIWNSAPSGRNLNVPVRHSKNRRPAVRQAEHGIGARLRRVSASGRRCASGGRLSRARIARFPKVDFGRQPQAKACESPPAQHSEKCKHRRCAI